jgi:hypothetical protein
MKKFIFLLIIVGIFPFIFINNLFADESLLKKYTTYQTSLENMDIAEAFFNNSISYLSRSNHYLCDYEVYTDKNKQNYSWSLYVYQNTYNWGTVFTITFHISNGVFRLKCADTAFKYNGVSADEFFSFDTGTAGRSRVCFNIVNSYQAFIQESKMALKMFNEKYGEKSLAALAFPGFAFIMQ